MSLLTSWLAFTDDNGLPDLYCRFVLNLWDTPVTVTGKAWVATNANEIMMTFHWVY